jgi:hypothetical protein
MINSKRYGGSDDEGYSEVVTPNNIKPNNNQFNS